MGTSMINEAGGWGPVRGSSVDLPRSDEGGERDGKKQNHNGASPPSHSTYTVPLLKHTPHSLYSILYRCVVTAHGYPNTTTDPFPGHGRR